MGSNMAECHPVGFQWVMEAKERGAKVIHVDPRFTRTSAMADLHVPIRAGSDIAFLGGLIKYVIDNGLYFEEYVKAYTNAAALIQTGLQTPGGIFNGLATIDNGVGGAGNTLTINAVTSGTVHLGDTIVGAGIAPGTTITAFLTGAGGLGTYTVSGAAQHITPAEAVTVSSTATVTYDAIQHAFLIHSPTTGANSAAGFATGTLAASLRLQQAQGAQVSAGAAAATPAGALAGLVGITQNFATFMTVWEPDTATKLAFAQALQGYNDRYAYVAWDSDASPLAGAAPASFGAQCVAAAFDGLWVQYEPATDDGSGRKAAFICGTAASIDYNQPGGRITFAYKGQAGLVADITNAVQADNLIANGYNFYGAYATANDRFVFTQRGTTPGKWKFFDSYVNQIWLNSNCQLALMGLMVAIKDLPYTTEGYSLLRTTLADPIRAALNAGVIRAGVTLSGIQRATINSQAGANAADTLQTVGWYLQILDAPPTVRAVRGSPPMTLWYMDGESIQNLDLASVNVQ